MSGVYSPGSFIPAMAAIAAHVEETMPWVGVGGGGVPLFTSAATVAAARLFASLRFIFASLGVKRATEYYADNNVLMVSQSVPGPGDDGASGGKPGATTTTEPADTTTRIARTIEEVMKVLAIRAATCIHKQRAPIRSVRQHTKAPAAQPPDITTP